MANNRSFETAGLVQGTADLWNLAVRYSLEGIAVFGAAYSGPTMISWLPSELFEAGWYLPFFVHGSQDTAHAVTTADASVGGGWMSVYNLLEELNADLRGHADTAGHVHRVVDSTTSYYASLFSRPTTPTEAQNNAEWLRLLLHYVELTGVSAGHLSSWPAVHRKEDVLNRVTGPTASDLTSTVDLVNEIKLKFNTHITLTRYGQSNEFSTLYLNDVAHADLPARQAGLVGDLSYEGFERGWSVPGMTTSGKISDQSDLVDMDTPGGSGIWGSLTWGVGMWGTGSVSWPSGHIQFLYDWGLIRSQVGVPAGEIFENGWRLPGSHVWPTNDQFRSRYYDASQVGDLVLASYVGTKIMGFAATTLAKSRISVRDGSFVPAHLWETLRITGQSKNVGDHTISAVISSTDVEVLGTVIDESAVDADVQVRQPRSPWRFNDIVHLQLGIKETFESGWRDCEIGAARYWSGSEWRFTTAQIDPCMLGSYTFGSYDLAYDDEYEAPALVDFSRTVALHVVASLSDGQFWMQFRDRDGITQACYWFIDETTAGVGKVVTEIGLTSIETDPRYPFKQQFNGIKEILDLSKNFTLPLGKAEWRGTQFVAEQFETGWTLTLDI